MFEDHKEYQKELDKLDKRRSNWDEESDSDHYSLLNYYGYNDPLLMKFASALIYNYTFDLSFNIKATYKQDNCHSICPCTSMNEKWRKLFDIDCCSKVDDCNTNEHLQVTPLLQHLQSKHKEGNCYLHSLAYLYIVKLYSPILTCQFLQDLPKEASLSASSPSSTSRKRKQESSPPENVSISKKRSSPTSHPPSNIECVGSKNADSSSISTITTSVSKISSEKRANTLHHVNSPSSPDPDKKVSAAATVSVSIRSQCVTSKPFPPSVAHASTSAGTPISSIYWSYYKT